MTLLLKTLPWRKIRGYTVCTLVEVSKFLHRLAELLLFLRDLWCTSCSGSQLTLLCLYSLPLLLSLSLSCACAHTHRQTVLTRQWSRRRCLQVRSRRCRQRSWSLRSRSLWSRTRGSMQSSSMSTAKSRGRRTDSSLIQLNSLHACTCVTYVH